MKVDVLLFFFFFSSRRRHTRSLRDWSSDVCSSDLLNRITPEDRCLCLAQIFRRDAIESDQDVVIGAQLDVIARRRRAVEHDRGEVCSMCRAQILDESVECFLYHSLNHRSSPASSRTSTTEVATST